MVGIALIPHSLAISCCSSTSTLMNCAFGNLLGRASKFGAIALQGPHQVAQKSTTESLGEAVSLAKSGRDAGWRREGGILMGDRVVG